MSEIAFMAAKLHLSGYRPKVPGVHPSLAYPSDKPVHWILMPRTRKT